MKNKFLIDGRLLSNKPTGISRYTEELIEGYCQRHDTRCITVLISNDYEPKRKDVTFIRTNLKPFNVIDFVRLYFFLTKIDFTVFHSPFYASSYFKKRGTVYITTVHDLMYRKVKKFFSENPVINNTAILYYDFIVKKTIQNSDIVVSVSDTTARDVKSAFNRTSIKISEGINTITEATFSEQETDEFLQSINLKRKNFFLYVGNLRVQKNIPFLISAFSKTKTDKKLVLAGNYKAHEIKKYLPVLDKRIIFQGFVDDQHLPLLYRHCAAFIYPSLYEGFGLPVLEALQYNARVFTSNGGALKEFPSTAVNFFNPLIESELIYLIDNKDKLITNDNVIKNALAGYNWKTLMNTMHDEIANTKILS